MPWNPDQYEKFKAERFAPFEDLLSQIIVRDEMNVIDLGCGSGELTTRVADHLPRSQVLGVDSSDEMLARAGKFARDKLTFERRAIEEVDGDWDLVFSHAAVQWVDDHEALVPRLLSMVRPGGQLAVQMPSNHNHATHRIIGEIAGEEPFRSALRGWSRQSPVLGASRYAELLYRHGGERLIVFEKVYPHVLENSDALAEWTSGTALVPYFDRLSDELREQFMVRYRLRLNALWPESPVFYGFQRILFSAVRKK